VLLPLRLRVCDPTLSTAHFFLSRAIIMKFSCACIVAALTTAGFAARTSHAFSAVAPQSSKAANKAGSGAPNLDPVDKSMSDIDAGNDSAFDPTSGSGAALTRNNKGEVWVSQVRSLLTIVPIRARASH
jgi:hypothetical protein